MSLSTAQVRALRAIRDANDSGHGALAPSGPPSRPYKFLINCGYATRKPGEQFHHITDAGREALKRVEQGAVP